MQNTAAVIHVVVGVIKNSQKQLLIARRPQHVHQGGLWEFPGGKVEANESPGRALQRELYEELGIEIGDFQPLGKVRHDYADKSVLLDVYIVDRFAGVPQGREGQPIQWVSMEQLDRYTFPKANEVIIRMLTLPELCLVTGKFDSPSDFIERLEVSLKRGIRLVQLRLKDIDQQTQLDLARQAFELCQRYSAMLLLNPSLGHEHGLDVAGMHLTSQQLFEFTKRPVAKDKLLSASVHDLTELAQAEKLQADFVLVSPVLPTTSHPDTKPLGWERFKAIAEQASCPVFALGGVDASHLSQAKSCSAQGIAAISAFWGKGR